MEGSVLSFLKAEWKVSDTGSVGSSFWELYFFSFQIYLPTGSYILVRNGQHDLYKYITVYMYASPKDYNNTEGKKGGIYVCYTKRLQQY